MDLQASQPEMQLRFVAAPSLSFPPVKIRRISDMIMQIAAQAVSEALIGAYRPILPLLHHR